MSMVKNMSNLRQKTLQIAWHAALLAFATGAIFLAGCVVGPKYHQPAATSQAPPMSYKESPTQNPDSGDWKVAQPQDAMLHGKWWEIYNDPELNSLEDQVNINNQNIKQYFENFMEARTLIAQARSQLYPTLGVGPSYQISRSSANLHNNTTSSSSGSSGSGSSSATSGAKSATPSMKPNTMPNSVKPISKTNASPNRPASPSFFSSSAARMLYRKFMTIPSPRIKSPSNSPAPAMKPA
jgi:hypothetical protein